MGFFSEIKIKTKMEPYYDILGIEQNASSDTIETAYARLNTYYDRANKLDTDEYTDIENAYTKITTEKPVYPEDYIIDRSIWSWVTCKDNDGTWNTLVRKSHLQKMRKATDWESDIGKATKLKKEQDRKKGRKDRGYGNDD